MGYYIDSSGNLRHSADSYGGTLRREAAQPDPAGADPSGRGPEPRPEVQTSSVSPPDYSNRYNRPSREFPAGAEATPFRRDGEAFTQRFYDEQTEEWVTYSFTWGDLIDAGIMDRMPTTDKEATNLIATAKRRFAGVEPGTAFDDLTPDPSSGGSGRGRSGGTAAAPVYLAPNREEVAEQLKSYVVATTGKNNADVLKDAVDAYMKADKAAWDMQVSGKGGEQPSPFMAAKNVVRATDEYKTIHYLRPDSVDEMDWVTGTQGKLRQLGISAARSEELGIQQASVGATDRDLVGASEVSLQSNNKLMAESQRAKLKQSVSAVARMIK